LYEIGKPVFRDLPANRNIFSMENKGAIVIYESPDSQTSIDVKLENETVWLSLAQISQLLKKDKSVISINLRDIYNEGD
jgi:hypothetical protein